MPSREVLRNRERPPLPVSAVAPCSPSISVIGLSPEGLAAVARLSRLGIRVVGVDGSAEAVGVLRSARASSGSAQLDRWLEDGVRDARIDATQNLIGAILETSVTIISEHGGAEPFHHPPSAGLVQISRGIGMALAMKQGFHVVLHETSGRLGDMALEIEAASGKQAGLGFGLCAVPPLTPARSAPRQMRISAASDALTGRIASAILEGVQGTYAWASASG